MQFIIIDIHGQAWGPFDDPIAAAKWAQAKWPDHDQANDDNGQVGWKHVSLLPPEHS